MICHFAMVTSHFGTGEDVFVTNRLPFVLWSVTCDESFGDGDKSFWDRWRRGRGAGGATQATAGAACKHGKTIVKPQLVKRKINQN